RSADRARRHHGARPSNLQSNEPAKAPANVSHGRHMIDVRELFDLSGKTALITGGSRGLGFEIARAFAACGADIVVASRKLDACQAAADEIRGMGRKALALSVHAGRWAEIDALVESTYNAFGKLDILVNNAGMSPASPSHEVSESLFDSVVNLNFK